MYLEKYTVPAVVVPPDQDGCGKITVEEAMIAATQEIPAVEERARTASNTCITADADFITDVKQDSATITSPKIKRTKGQ